MGDCEIPEQACTPPEPSRHTKGRRIVAAQFLVAQAIQEW